MKGIGVVEISGAVDQLGVRENLRRMGKYRVG
jgi:hypothetical protein